MELIQARWKQGKFLCVGLDTDATRLPNHLQRKWGVGRDQAVLEFNRAIIEAAADLVCAFKLNRAFYDALGEEGSETLARSIAAIEELASDVPSIVDAKIADTPDTNTLYAAAMFDELRADAVTVNPYLGGMALRPLLERKDKGIFVLCKTSNEGAGEFQDMRVDGRPLFLQVALNVKQWNVNGNCGLVVGARYIPDLAEVRKRVGSMPILIPGVGAQGGDLNAAVKAGRDSTGQGIIVNVSRSIIFASGGEDFAEVARAKALEYHEQIQEALGS